MTQSKEEHAEKKKQEQQAEEARKAKAGNPLTTSAHLTPPWYENGHPGVIEFNIGKSPWVIDSAHITQILATTPNCSIGGQFPSGTYPSSSLFPTPTPFTFNPHSITTGSRTVEFFVALSQNQQFGLLGFRVDRRYLNPVTLYGYWMDGRPLFGGDAEAFEEFLQAFAALNAESISAETFLTRFHEIQKRMTGGTGTYGAGNQGT